MGVRVEGFAGFRLALMILGLGGLRVFGFEGVGF